MMDELGQRKMNRLNRDQALSTTYSTILKIHKKVVGRRPPGSIGPATKDVEKKNGGSNSEEDEKEDTYESPSFDDYK